ncbi:MAG TPA: Gfo/Idh/MocA family oxidoreductase [Verrucomicrobiae bacterium]|nr:Gfo/Idh/MocA family oxidoreductase [Verrucomicrobiae bacterium]
MKRSNKSAKGRGEVAPKVIRYAVVGLGNISQAAVLPGFLNATTNSKLTALVSDDPKKLEQLSKLYDVDPADCYDYAEYQKCLESGRIDAVYIALPNSLHLPYTVQAAKAGIHVLCEKPLAVDERECQAMIRACERNHVKLMGAYRLHFERSNLEAIRIVQSGEIGEPRFFTSTFSQQVKAGVRTQKKMGGGSLYDLGVYCINAARYLFQADPLKAIAFSVKGHDSRFREVDEMTAATLEFPGQRLATFISSFGAENSAVYEVIGTKGKLRAISSYEYSVPARLEITVGKKTKVQPYVKRDQFGPELLYFSDCILNNRTPEPSGLEGMIDVHIIRSLYKAAQTGRVVTLKKFPRHHRPNLRQNIQRRVIKPLGKVNTESTKK